MLKSFKPFVDLAVTLALWSYYLACYLVFCPVYFGAYFFSACPERAFQKVNCLLYRSFFFVMQAITPGLTIRIAPEFSKIRSSVVIANHLSFLDSILFVSLFEQQKTIVKQKFFSIPLFGAVLKISGYIAPLGSGVFSEDMMGQIARLQEHFAAGGNLFVFPEGTRSRTGAVGPFEKGAFSIAKLCKAPVRVVRITNTGRLYPPDSFLFNTCIANRIEVTLAGSIEPEYDNSTVPVSELMGQARDLLEGKKQKYV